MTSQLAWIPGLPLAAFAILILMGRRLGRASAWLAVVAMAAALVATLGIAPAVLRHESVGIRWPWLSPTDYRWAIGLMVDELSLVMLFVVTIVGTLIQLYSIGYMHDDPRVSRFFAYLSLFCASMLGLVMADHFILLYACWELVGLCSYLLISFWFEKPEAARAGRKAFITTRIGDTGLLLGILLLAFTAGALRFDHLDSIRTKFLLEHNEALLTLISVLIFCGAVGKSAQVPLHVWLPDAMEGPTPVSALIHAATMVAAGVYLVARTLPLFTPQSLLVVLGIGLVTHLFAGTIALTQTDIKRVLAYSTISQLGLMMTALGLSAMPAAMFHLVTHAWFKALLFLGAGSVIHATHQQDLAHLGGLARSMRWTHLTFLVAALTMSGIPPLSGFWSKDAILLEAKRQAPWVFWCLLGGAIMTVGYIFRLYFRCFHGSPSSHAAPVRESPAIMTIPLALLAVGAALVGFLGSPVAHQWFFQLLGAHELHEGLDVGMVLISLAVAGYGIWLAWQVGMKHRRLLPAVVQPLGRRLYTWAAHKYFVDEAYDRLIIQPVLRGCQALLRFDLRVIDGAVNGAGASGWRLSQLKDWIDRNVVDGLVNGVAQFVRAVSTAGRRIQTGLVHHYLLGVVAAVVILAVWLR